MNIQTIFAQWLADKGIQLSDRQLDQFRSYYQLLVEWNEKMNLTGITEIEAVYEKHFFDSVSLAFYIDLLPIGRMVDVGSGAGFPSIPLKICFPHLKVTIIDSLNKRVQFLNHVVQQLELTDVECVHGRAEDIARLDKHRDQYDLATARAVARLSVLNEFCLPFVRAGGIFAAMKGADPQQEVEAAAISLKELQGKQRKIHHFKLPVEQSDRHIIVIDKLRATPRKYPRKAGTPLKQPLE